MRVLLVHPADFPDPARPAPLLPPNQAPPLGLSYIAAWVRAQGRHEVRILDTRHARSSREDFRREIRAFQPQLVGMGCYTVTVPVAREMAGIVREECGAKIVLGGPHPAGAPESCARDLAFDFVGVGEGERIVSELADTLESGADLRKVPGLWFRERSDDPEGPLVINEARSWFDDLDSLPLPARDLLPPLASYRMNMFQYREWPATTMYTSRGCPYSCIFCERRELLGNRFRVRAPEKVVDEMEFLAHEEGIKEIFFYDDTFTLDGRRVHQICDTILRRGVKVSWNISTHVNTVDKEMLSKMARAGCWQIAYGLETGDPRVIKDILKGTDLGTVRERIEWTKEAGIEPKGLFMIGHPTDTAESIARTVEFARSLPLVAANFKIATPFVGTPMREMAKEYGDLREDDLRNFKGDPDGNGAVFCANGLTREYLSGVQRRAYFRFYAQPRRLMTIARTMTSAENRGKWVEGARIMGRLLRHQVGGAGAGRVQEILEFEH
jgi:radical SAM superfamily enzyme YgiQ (UPF0313 family)